MLSAEFKVELISSTECVIDEENSSKQTCICSELQSTNFFFLKQVKSGQVANVREKEKKKKTVTEILVLLFG